METGRLVQLIQQYGVSWSLLKEKDEDHPENSFLRGRSNTDLRGRALNLKIAMLKYVSANQPTLHPYIPN